VNIRHYTDITEIHRDGNTKLTQLKCNDAKLGQGATASVASNELM